MTSRTQGTIAALTAVVLTGCANAPAPAAVDETGIEVPDQWSGPDAGATSAAPVDSWWSGFGDARLDEAIAAALEHNRDLRAAAARLEAALQDRVATGAASLPEVDASFDPQRSRRVFVGFPFGSGGVPSSTTTTFGISLNVRWELDVWGRVAAAESAALADLQAVAADHAAARTSLVAQVCKSWFAVVEARQQLDLAVATVDAFSRTEEDVRDRHRRGLRPALDVHLAANNAASAEAVVSQRRDALQRTLRALDILAGRYPLGDTATPQSLPASLPPVPACLPGNLLQRRPDLVAAERRLAASGCRVDSARAALYPRLSLTASGGTTSEELEDLVDQDFRVWSLGANLLQPIFRGGALRADVARREALRAESLATYGGTVLRAFAEVESALASETHLGERRAALARAAEHASQSRDLARERWQLGLADFLAVADGQRQAYLATSALIALDRQRLDNRIDLFLALGGGFAPVPEATGPNP